MLPTAGAARMADVINNRWVLDATFRGRYAADTVKAATKLAHIAGRPSSTSATGHRRADRRAPLQRLPGRPAPPSAGSRACRRGENDINHNGTGDQGLSSLGSSRAWASHACTGVPTTIGTGLSIPRGLYDLLLRIKNDYPNATRRYITENGMGYKDDFEDGFIDDALASTICASISRGSSKAINGGVNVDGYFMWSLQDQFSWTNGYNKRYGLFYIDFETGRSAIPGRARTGTKNVAETGLLMALVSAACHPSAAYESQTGSYAAFVLVSTCRPFISICNT